MEKTCWEEQESTTEKTCCKATVPPPQGGGDFKVGGGGAYMNLPRPCLCNDDFCEQSLPFFNGSC